MKQKLQLCLSFCLSFKIIFLCVLPLQTAQANAPAPPLDVWFSFHNDMPIHLQSIQVLGCEGICDQPELLVQYGDCFANLCLTTPPKFTVTEGRLECAGDRCLLVLTYGVIHSSDLPSHAKLLVLLPDGARMSDPFPAFDREPFDFSTFRGDIAWKVDLETTPITILPDSNFEDPNSHYNDFWLTFLLTLVVELIAAGIFLIVWRRFFQHEVFLWRNLVWVAVINLISYPIVWLVLPAWGVFQPGYRRSMGWFLILVVVLSTLVLRSFTRTDNRRRWFKTSTILGLIGAPILTILWALWLFASAYGSTHYPAQGMSPGMVIFVSEIFAVVFEAFLMSVFTRKAIPLKVAFFLSFLMNITSFLAGQWVFGL